MDYKELIEQLKSMLPEKVLYGDLIGAEGVYAHSGPMVYEDPEPYFIEQAITAITDLLARAEAAEAENTALRKMQPVQLDESGARALELAAEVSKLKQKLAAAEARAEKAERERDAAIERIKEDHWCEDCKYCHVAEACRNDGLCFACNAPCYCEDCDSGSKWEWRGKEE